MFLSFDLFDFEPGELLPMAGLFALTFFGFVMEDGQLGAFDLLDLGLNLDSLEEGSADGDVVAIGQEQHFLEGVCRSIVQGEAVYFNRAAFFATVLFAAALNDCILHGKFSNLLFAATGVKDCVPISGEGWLRQDVASSRSEATLAIIPGQDFLSTKTENSDASG
jgi:hypothetical protein